MKEQPRSGALRALLYCFLFISVTLVVYNMAHENPFPPTNADSEVKFMNPYDKGMLCNIRDFLKPEW